MYADAIHFLQHRPDCQSRVRTLAYVQPYRTKQYGTGLVEQLEATERKYIDATTIQTLLARITTTSGGSTLRQPLKTRTWVIDRCRMYKLLARANGYSWDDSEASEDIGEEEEEMGRAKGRLL